MALFWPSWPNNDGVKRPKRDATPGPGVFSLIKRVEFTESSYSENFTDWKICSSYGGFE